MDGVGAAAMSRSPRLLRTPDPIRPSFLPIASELGVLPGLQAFVRARTAQKSAEAVVVRPALTFTVTAIRPRCGWMNTTVWGPGGS
jgi:hypothetical protein